MEPLYECRDHQPAMKYGLIAMAVGLMIMPFVVPMEGEPPADVWILRLMLLFCGLLIFVAMPDIKIRATQEYVEVRYGMLNLINFRLSNEKITSIKAVKYNPVKDFGGWGIKYGRGKWRGWFAYTGSITNTALSIETTEKNYLIGCSVPSEAEAMLSNIIGMNKNQ